MQEETTVPACIARHLHHVCMAVRDIESTLNSTVIFLILIILKSNLFKINLSRRHS